MYKFDTKVQHLKYKVLREVARCAWDDTLLENVMDIPLKIVPGKVPTMRCCVYKERAILGERVKLAMGGNKDNPNVIEVIDIACDECPMGGYDITSACRGCLAHRCIDACKFGAITLDQNHVAHIDKSKCKECGSCAKVCPYSAIICLKRPCENACKIKAIKMNEDKAAAIDNSKCISCGACVYQCPFGAIMEKSYILDAIDMIKKSEGRKKGRRYIFVLSFGQSSDTEVFPETCTVSGGCALSDAGSLQGHQEAHSQRKDRIYRTLHSKARRSRALRRHR